MRHLEQIDHWIKEIENSNLKPAAKTKKINHLVDTWKFASFYHPSSTLSAEDTICIENEEIHVNVKDLLLNPSNVIERLFSEVQLQLNQESNHKGKYNILFHKFDENFCSEKVNSLKQELLSVVKGEVIQFEHIEYVHKHESEKVELFNSTIKMLECDTETIQKVLDSTPAPKSSKKKWLLLVLDHLKNNCNTFLINDYIREAFFKSGFDRIFLFDFYKGQIIPLSIKK